MTGKTKFGELFKRYRLKAGIPTLSEFGHLLAEKGFNYEDSIFSHWQKGSRVPQYRVLLLKIIEIFREKGVFSDIQDVNELLESANQNNLSEQEIENLQLNSNSKEFQVPNEIANFVGRKDIIDDLLKRNLAGKTILIYGPAGVGKTALAIRLGHLLRDRYKDGVLWYKIEEDNISDILFSIAKILGEDISRVSDIQVRGTIVRSLLSSKDLLLFLDSGELSTQVELLIPNSESCTTIITSQKNQHDRNNSVNVKMVTFTNNESLLLFRSVLKNKYPKIGRRDLSTIATKVGNLPFVVHLLARELQQSTDNFKNILGGELFYGNDVLISAISSGYEKLENQERAVLMSAAIFKGKDFSLDSIAYINGLPKSVVLNRVERLTSLSLLEHSTGTRFRMHPAIKDFVRQKLDYPRSSYLSLFAVLIFVFFTAWWIFIQIFLDKDSRVYDIFSATYGIMALYGALCGLSTSLGWGGLKTLMGRAIFMFSLGLFLQEFGQLSYSYYTYFRIIEVPYPSIADFGFFGTIPAYIYGAILVARSSGIPINKYLSKVRIFGLAIASLLLASGYLFLLGDILDGENPLKILLDFGYPFGEAISVLIAIGIFIFSRNILDGIMKSKALLILLALSAQFIADYLFIFTLDSFYAGNYVDFVFLIAYFIMTLALLSLKSIQIRVP